MLRTLAVILALGASTAQAQPGMTGPVAPSPQDYAVEDTSYAMPVVSASAAGIGLFLAGALAEQADGRDTQASGGLMTAGLVTMVLGAPLVHAAHGEVRRGAISASLRLSLGAIVGAYAVASASCSDDELLCGLDRLGPGIVIGVGIASVIDAAALTRRVRMRPVGPVRTAWAPVLAPARGGAQLGLVATF